MMGGRARSNSKGLGCCHSGTSKGKQNADIFLLISLGICDHGASFLPETAPFVSAGEVAEARALLWPLAVRNRTALAPWLSESEFYPTAEASFVSVLLKGLNRGSNGKTYTVVTVLKGLNRGSNSKTSTGIFEFFSYR